MTNQKYHQGPPQQLCDITQTKATILALLGESSSCFSGEDSEMQCEGRAYSNHPNQIVLNYADQKFSGECADRIFIYNPDAIGYWIYQKYEAFFRPIKKRASLCMKLATVYPPVTPVCFASMYTGLVPSLHGIMKYEKYPLEVPTLFDALSQCKKRTAIISTRNDSMSILFLNRTIDYFIYDTIAECNQKAVQLIYSNSYDVIVLYNGNYDYYMHRNSPTGPLAKLQLKKNIAAYCMLHDKIRHAWSHSNTAMLFAPDHGAHRWLGILGNHGKMIQKDMEIPQFYSFLPRSRRD